MPYSSLHLQPHSQGKIGSNFRTRMPFKSSSLATFLLPSYAIDPYAVLAILGFMVFLFYTIYNFLNSTGNGKRSFLDLDWVLDIITQRGL